MNHIKVVKSLKGRRSPATAAIVLPVSIDISRLYKVYLNNSFEGRRFRILAQMSN